MANRVVVHTGAVKQAIRVLRWWADDEGDDPQVLEMIKQSRECARDLEQDLKKQQRVLDTSSSSKRKRRRRPLVGMPVR